MNTIYIKPWDWSIYRDLRVTQEGQKFVFNNYKIIMPILIDILHNDSLSNNSKVLAIYDYLEDFMPGLFDNFCNMYFYGQVVDTRNTSIDIKDIRTTKEKIQHIEEYKNLFNLNEYNTSIMVKLFETKAYIPIQPNQLKFVLNFLTTLAYLPYKNVSYHKKKQFIVYGDQILGSHKIILGQLLSDITLRDNKGV